jgi:hypothetical protein
VHHPTTTLDRARHDLDLARLRRQAAEREITVLEERIERLEAEESPRTSPDAARRRIADLQYQLASTRGA